MTNEDELFPPPPVPPNARHVSVTIYIPLPQALPLPDRTVFSSPPTHSQAKAYPIRTRYWRVPDYATKYTSALKAMEHAAARAHELTNVPADDSTVMDLPTHLHGTQTVVECLSTFVDGPTNDPNFLFDQALDQSLDALEQVVRSIRVTAMQPLELPSRETLPPTLLVLATDAERPEQEPSRLPAPWFVRGTRPPISVADELSDDQIDELEFRSGIYRAGSRAHTFRDALIEARTAFELRGDTSSAVVWAHLAVESFMDLVLGLLLWEEGWRPRDAAEPFARALRDRARHFYHNRLGGNWDLKHGPLAVWSGPGALAHLRGRVVHAGYNPTRGDAQRSVDAIMGVQRFLGGRVRSVRTAYPRTTMLMLGRAALEDEGLFAGEFAGIIGSIADLEPSWAHETTRWRTHVDRVLESDGGLTGVERLSIDVECEQVRYWIWDPEDESVSLTERDLQAANVAFVGDAAVRWGDAISSPVPVPGARPAAHDASFFSPGEYGLEEPANSPWMVDLHDRLESRGGVDASAVKAAFLVSVADEAAQMDGGRHTARIVEEAFEGIAAVQDMAVRGDLGLAGGLCARWSLEQAETAMRLLDDAAMAYSSVEETVRFGAARLEAGTTAHAVGDHEAAKWRLEEAMSEFAQAGDLRGQARAAGNLGTLLRESGDSREAEEMQNRASSLFSFIGDTEGLAKSTAGLAQCLAEKEEAGNAKALYLEAGQLFSQAYEPAQAANAACSIAALSVLDGLHQTAATLIARTADAVQPVDDFDLGGTFASSVFQVQAEDSERDVPTSVRLVVEELNESGYPLPAAQAVLALAEYEAGRGHIPEAIALADEAWDAVSGIEAPHTQLSILEVAFFLRTARSEHQEALRKLEAQYDIALRNVDAAEVGGVACNAVVCNLELGYISSARAWAERARIDAQMHQLRGWARALEGVCDEYDGRPADAQECWREAAEELRASPSLAGTVQEWLDSGTSAASAPEYLSLWSR